jgi:hypothetical protein
MLVRYLPVIFVLTALVLALAPLEAAGQSASDTASSPAGASHKADKPRPRTGGAPVNANASKAPIPPGEDARRVRPAEAFPPERIAPSDAQTPQAQTPQAQTPQAPSRGGVVTPDPAAAFPVQKNDPRSVEERPDPGG